MILFACGLMSKSMLVSVPLVLLLPRLLAGGEKSDLRGQTQDNSKLEPARPRAGSALGVKYANSR